jgi:short-subunit dehydrogenase
MSARRARFSGKTAFIVGGSSGIGRELARQLTKEGARVAIFARRQLMLDEAANDIGAGDRLSCHTLDAAHHGDVEAAFSDAIANRGVPDILINAAGGAKPQEFEKVTDDDLAWTLGANLYACWYPCKVIAPQMKARGKGAIVNVSSVAGLIGVYGYTDYTLAKAGLIGFSDALRSELKPFGVTVQVLCPPDTETPGFERENETKPAITAALSEGASLLSPADVATACLKQIGDKPFLILANRESKFIEVLRRFAPGMVRGQIDSAIAKALRKAK